MEINLVTASQVIAQVAKMSITSNVKVIADRRVCFERISQDKKPSTPSVTDQALPGGSLLDYSNKMVPFGNGL